MSPSAPLNQFWMQPKVYPALYISHHTIMEMTHALKCWIYADLPRGQWCTNRAVFNWKDMCSPYGCGHGCLVSEWVHIALLQKRTCAKYFFRLIFFHATNSSCHHLTQHRGFKTQAVRTYWNGLCLWKMTARKYLPILHWVSKPLKSSLCSSVTTSAVCSQYIACWRLLWSYLTPLVLQGAQTLSSYFVVTI